MNPLNNFPVPSRSLLIPGLLVLLVASGGWGGVVPQAVAAAATGVSADGLWTLQAEAPAARTDREVAVQPAASQPFSADLTRLHATLTKAPFEGSLPTSADASKEARREVEISLPLPSGGKFGRFRVREVAIMAPALAAKYPEIKTYRGQGIDDPSASVALDVTPAGFHAQVIAPSGWVYVDPLYAKGEDSLYLSYYKRDLAPDPSHPWECYTGSGARALRGASSLPLPQLATGPTLRTYRLACAANGEYVATTGGTVASGLAAVVVIINRVSAICESEVAARLQLVPNNDLIIYTDPATDPYSNGTGALNQNTPNLNAVIGAANYDIGHVFTTGSGGVAGLGVVCGTNKGRGTTGLPTPFGDAFSVDFVAHEMGHQFGANHTFNGNTGNCSGSNRSAAHAYEPGSGTTIMAYAGICGLPSNLQPNSDAFFHSESLSEITNFISGTATCAVNTATGNNAPVADAGPDYTIPRLTPFALTGSALDPDGDLLTYSWEERDLGPAQAGAEPDNGTSPIFRSFTPSYNPVRTFPKLSDLLGNTTTIGEQLPSLARLLKFRLTVRDNRVGGVNSDDVALTVDGTSGPFRVTSPNTAVVTTAGAPLGVTWDVANTNLPPVSTANVSILLSLDGGYTYPVVLAASTPNTGAATVTLPPNAQSTRARVKVAAVGNVYFDVSDADFTVN